MGYCCTFDLSMIIITLTNFKLSFRLQRKDSECSTLRMRNLLKTDLIDQIKLSFDFKCSVHFRQLNRQEMDLQYQNQLNVEKSNQVHNLS